MNDFDTRDGVAVVVSKETHKRLKNHSRQRGMKISLVANHALRTYLEAVEKPETDCTERRRRGLREILGW